MHTLMKQMHPSLIHWHNAVLYPIFLNFLPVVSIKMMFSSKDPQYFRVWVTNLKSFLSLKLKQFNAFVTWDNHGYYDKLSLCFGHLEHKGLWRGFLSRESITFRVDGMLECLMVFLMPTGRELPVQSWGHFTQAPKPVGFQGVCFNFTNWRTSAGWTCKPDNTTYSLLSVAQSTDWSTWMCSRRIEHLLFITQAGTVGNNAVGIGKGR